MSASEQRFLIPAMIPPRGLSALLGLMLCAAPSCAATNSPSTNAISATTLDLFWGAAPTFHCCFVKGDGQKLTYEFTVPGKKNSVTIVPTKEAWDKFWKTMDEVRLWDWQEHYNNPHVMDGLVWSLDIKRGERKARSGGSNGYPSLDRLSKLAGEPTEIFRKYQMAVEELMGRKLWKE